MSEARRVIRPLLLCAVLFCAAAHGDRVLIENVTVISADGEAGTAVMNVLISGEHIEAVSAGPVSGGQQAVVIDGTGRYLTPGLTDAHVHVSAVPGLGYHGDGMADRYPELTDAYFRQQPRSLLYHGVTQVLDPNPGQSWDEFVAAPQHPDYFRCEVVATPQSYPLVELPTATALVRYPYFVLDRPLPGALAARYPMAEHAPEASVTRLADAGAICVKIFVENGFGDADQWPTLGDGLTDRIMRATAERGLPVFVHANSLDTYTIALRHPPDAILHGLWNWGSTAGREAPDSSSLPPGVRSTVDRAAAAGVAFGPTLGTLAGLRALMLPDALEDPALRKVTPEALLDWYRTPESGWFRDMLFEGFGAGLPASWIAGRYRELLDRASAVARHSSRQSYPLLFGSDTPGSPSWGNQPGLASYRELERLAAAGVPLAEIFDAATIGNARLLSIDDDYGTVVPGKLANLLLLRSNPLEDIRAWSTIDQIVLRGEIIERESLAADAIPLSPAL